MILSGVSFGKDVQKTLTAEWKADVASKLAAEVARVAAGLPPSVPPASGQPASSSAASSSSAALPPGAASSSSASSSGPAAPALCVVPAMCVATLGQARKKFAIQMMLPPVADPEGSDSDEEPPDFVAPAMPVIMRAPNPDIVSRSLIIACLFLLVLPGR